MERNANYALVGLVSTVLLMALVIFVVWLAGSSLNRDYALYDIVFQGPVRGLSQGGEVHFNGIKVGEVSKIFLDPSDSRLVIARARVTDDVPIRQDSFATLEPLGITGVNYVQISAGTGTLPLLKDIPHGDRPTAPLILRISKCYLLAFISSIRTPSGLTDSGSQPIQAVSSP